LQNLFDFNAGVSGESASGIEGEIVKRFPKLDSAAGGGSAKFHVTANVRLDGQATWGVREHVAGSRPEGVTGSFADDSSELQVLVQNLVRADIYRKLEALG
jgi:hypothetical protein